MALPKTPLLRLNVGRQEARLRRRNKYLQGRRGVQRKVRRRTKNWVLQHRIEQNQVLWNAEKWIVSWRRTPYHK